MIVIEKNLTGVTTTEEKIIDFNAKLKYIADWLEKTNDAQIFVCAFDGEHTMFVGVEGFDDMHQRKTLTLLDYELMLQHSIEQGIVEIFAEFVEAEGKSMT